MLGGLYGDLPPPSSTSEDDKAPSNSNVWSSSAKMAPPTLRKPFFPPTQALLPRPQPRPKPQPTIQPTSGPTPSSSFHPSLAGPTSNVVEEYDPARPNDYEEYLRERRQRQADAERRREAEERARKEREMEERESSERERDLNISGEEAWRRRAAMSGGGGGGGGGGDFSIGKSESGGMGVGAEGKMTTAERMMAKMGWKAGKGLGREEQGMTKALSVRKTDKRAGAIVNESEAAKQQQQQGGVEKKVKSVQFNMAPTRVVLLRNMVCLRLILGCR